LQDHQQLLLNKDAVKKVSVESDTTAKKPRKILKE
jgi:hypothetical protein